MNDKWKVRLRHTLWGSAFAFLFPFVSVIVLASGERDFKAALLAGAINAVLAGPSMTFLFAFIVPYTRRFSFLPAILIQYLSFLTVGVVLITLNVAIVVAVLDRRPITDPSVIEWTREIIAGPDVQLAFAISVGFFFLGTMFLQVLRKLGPGVLWNWITGKYHRPREEQLVFMFLDLKDSTSLAERLGSLEFSALIQEFFSDLGWALWATKGTVSHYIGDEAVIVWRPDRAFKNANCFRIFSKLQEEIEKRSQFYQDRFGVIPTFKAGIHMGSVVAAEVGRAKSEIVYHGDAVNTTARIVGMCSSLGHDLLVSKEIADRTDASGYSVVPLGPSMLKGKEVPVELFAVRRALLTDSN